MRFSPVGWQKIDGGKPRAATGTDTLSTFHPDGVTENRESKPRCVAPRTAGTWTRPKGSHPPKTGNDEFADSPRPGHAASPARNHIRGAWHRERRKVPSTLEPEDGDWVLTHNAGLVVCCLSSKSVRTGESAFSMTTARRSAAQNGDLRRSAAECIGCRNKGQSNHGSSKTGDWSIRQFFPGRTSPVRGPSSASGRLFATGQSDRASESSALQ